MTPLDALLNLLAPGLIGAVLGLAVSLLPRSKDGAAPEGSAVDGGLLRRLAAPLVVGLAFFPVDVSLHQWHELWPKDGTNRFLAVAVAASAGGLVHAGVSLIGVTAVVRGLLGALIALGLLSPLPEQFVPRGVLVGLSVGTGLWLAGVGFALDRAEQRLARGVVPAGLMFAAGAAAPGLFENGYAGGARLAAGLAAIGGGLAVAAAIRGWRIGRLGGGWTVWLAVLAAILLVTYGYTDKAVWWSLCLMAAAPLGLLAGLPLKSGWGRAAVALVGAGVIAVGGTLAAMAAGSNDGPSEDDPYAEYS